MKVVYEGHQVKVVSTGAKSRKFLFQQCKTFFGNNSGSIKRSHEVCVKHRVFGYGIKWCERHLCHLTESDHT